MALSGSYLDVSEFESRSVAPTSLVNGDHIDPSDTVAVAAWLAFVQAQLIQETGRINARLRKRYPVPFVAPFPETVCAWLAARVTPKLYEKRGWDPSDAQAAAILVDAQAALDEMKEAADSDTGLFDLPILETSADTAITQGGPYAYSEPDAYTWTDVQREAVDGC